MPPETNLEEVQAIEERRNHFLREQDFRKQSKQIRESSNHGDVDAAVEALADAHRPKTRYGVTHGKEKQKYSI